MPSDVTAFSVLWLAATAIALGGSYVAGGYWIYVDAKARGSPRPHGWLFNWLVFTLFGLVHYLWVRDRIGTRSRPVSAIERMAFALVASVFFSFLYTAIFLPSDPVSQVWVIPVVVGIALPSVYLVLVGLDRVRDGQAG